VADFGNQGLNGRLSPRRRGSARSRELGRDGSEEPGFTDRVHVVDESGLRLEGEDRDELAVPKRESTFRLADGRRVIVYNPLYAPGRTRSNQAHELAHITLGHTLRTVEKVGDQSFVTCDVEQVEEADWMGGCLLLPRPILSLRHTTERPRRRSLKSTGRARRWRAFG
jgi:hypothetical protein